ncbi:MAG: chalcone isomerase family protein [Cystobacter sp.]
MERNGWKFAGLCAALLLIAGPAQAREMAGVRVPEEVTLEGKQLSLAHAELQQMFFFKVYVWSLYFEEPPRVKSEAISSNCIKRLQLRFLRNVTQSQLVDAFRDGLSRNRALRESPLRDDLERLLGSLRDVSKGGQLTLTYFPGGGLQVEGEATHGISIKGKPFADALFVSWLENHPIFAN